MNFHTYSKCWFRLGFAGTKPCWFVDEVGMTRAGWLVGALGTALWRMVFSMDTGKYRALFCPHLTHRLKRDLGGGEVWMIRLTIVKVIALTVRFSEVSVVKYNFFIEQLHVM